jgi:hypothetical protein
VGVNVERGAPERGFGFAGRDQADGAMLGRDGKARRGTGRRRALASKGLFELLERRQVGERTEAEVHQELARRGVEERPADDLLAARDPHHPALEQGLERRHRALAPQILDLRRGDRLAIGDDRQGLERRHREPVGARRVEETPQIGVELGRGHDPQAARHPSSATPRPSAGW